MDTEKIESPQVQVVDERQVRSAETKRAKEIAELGKQYDCMDDAVNAIQEGRSAGEFSRFILDSKMNEKPLEVPTDTGEIGLSERELKSYSITRAVDIFCNKGRFEGLEAEASEAAKQRYGRNSDGLCVPTDVLQRDLNIGTAVDGGNTKATDLLSGSFIDLLRNASVIAQTGATYLNGLSGDVAIPRQSATATASWMAEVGAVSETSAQVDQVTLSPKGLSAMTTYSKQLLAQSSIDIEQFVRNDLASILAVAQDLAAVDGLGSSNQPLGIMGTSGVGTITVNANNYINAVNLESEIAVDNALTGSLAYVTNGKFIGKLKQSEIAANSARFVYENGKVNGYPCFMSNQMPATYATNTKSAIIFGNFSDLLVGNWNGLDIVVDPYTSAANRQVRLVTSLWTDIAVRHAESFAYSKLVVH
jgi:HK97 family phage major capsid protein